MTLYKRYFTDSLLPNDPDEAKRIKRTADWYTIVDGRLYYRGYSIPYKRCLTLKEVDYALVRTQHQYGNVLAMTYDSARARRLQP
ncbi:hypothetical protein Nepgr_017556 [Nepenthes gracilis]|uniref:Uncharacterized protein n=1 Tax=Nepenthes gracilis TaxID=150966 RepID=A0AAD3SRM3_NEPGR|nr:hypothetical protein Nepgr_017556 [Nepenthes gracilis]